MKKNLFLSISILLILYQISEAQVFKISNQKIEMKTNKNLKVTASKNCFRKNLCLAVSKLSQIRLSKIVNTLNGRNPGAAICTDLLNSKTVVGIDSNKNYNCFCYFKKDQSYVDCGTLHFYGILNDKKNAR